MNGIDEKAKKDSNIDHSFPTTQPSRCLRMDYDVHAWYVAVVLRCVVPNFVNVLVLLNFIDFKSLHVLLSFFLLFVQLLDKPVGFSLRISDLFSQLFPIFSCSVPGFFVLHLSVFVIIPAVIFLSFNAELFFCLRSFLFKAWTNFLH